MSKKKGRITIFTLLLLFAIDVSISLLYQSSIGSNIKKINEFNKINSLVVLCAGITPNKGIDQTTKSRIKYAKKILEKYTSMNLILLGCHWKQIKNQGTMLDFAKQIGIPKNRIWADESSFDSLSNISELEEIIYSKKIQSILILSSPLHNERLKMLLQKKAMRSYPKILYLGYTPKANQTVFFRWKEFHHEMFARSMYFFLPDFLYKKLIRNLRK